MDTPRIEDLPISLECKVEEINQYNATLRIVAEIVNVSADQRILTEDGKIGPEKLNAISYDPAKPPISVCDSMQSLSSPAKIAVPRTDKID